MKLDQQWRYQHLIEIVDIVAKMLISRTWLFGNYLRNMCASETWKNELQKRKRKIFLLHSYFPSFRNLWLLAAVMD